MLFSLSARLQDRRCYLKFCLCNLLGPQRPIRRCPPSSHLGKNRAGSGVSCVTAFYLATTAGGIALDLPIGLLKPGYRFDALLIDTAVPDTDLRLYDYDNSVDILQKIIWNTNQRNIKKVWVNGRLVKG